MPLASPPMSPAGSELPRTIKPSASTAMSPITGSDRSRPRRSIYSLDGDVAAPVLGAANRHIAISLDGDVADIVFRTGAIQTTNLLGPIHLDSPASQPGAASYYDPADAAFQANPTATSSSQRTGGGRQVDAGAAGST